MDNFTPATFYVVEDDKAPATSSAGPMDFGEAYDRATALVKSGAHVRVLHTGEASQTEISRFVSRGIPTSRLSEA